MMLSKQPVHTNALMRPSVHTNTHSVFIKNAWICSENAHESGSKPEQKHNLSLWTFENRWKWKRSPNISQAYVFEACTQSWTYVTMCNSIVFKRFSVDIRKRIKTLVWVDTNRSMRFRWQHFWKHIYRVERVLKNNKNQIDSDGVLTFYLAFA